MEFSSTQKQVPEHIGGLRWLPEAVKEDPRLLQVDPSETGMDEDLVPYPKEDPGIAIWSFDHHVLRIPLYRGPKDDGECRVYKAHKDMLDKYWEFHPYQDETTPDTTSSSDEDNGTELDWDGVHLQFSQSLSKRDSDFIAYRTYLTGNIARAIEADHLVNPKPDSSKSESEYKRQATIDDHVNQLYSDSSDHTIWHAKERQRSDDKKPFNTEFQGDELVMAFYEALSAANKLNADKLVQREELVKELKIRVWNYPVQFSVDGAITATISVSSDIFSDQNMDILRKLSFFESPDSEASGGNMQLHLPLLLVNKQPRRSNKKSAESALATTSNKQRIAMTSAAWFLAYLGIQDFPVFGLVTCGEKGYLSQTWFSSKNKCCYVVDRNVRRDPFDLGADRRYQAFLSKLRDHAVELRERFRCSEMELFDGMKGKDTGGIYWSAYAQLAERWELD